MNARHVFLSLTASYAMVAGASAFADIGAIGSPVRGSSTTSAGAAAKAQEPAQNDSLDTDDRTPLLVIRFNQQHVYFERALRQAVESTSKAKPGARYDIVSMVPAGGTMEQSERISENAADNLGNVVRELQNLGVSPSQIHVTSQSSPTAVVQEVDIFVD